MRPCIFTLRKLPRADIESAPTVTGWRMPYGIRRGAFYMLPRAHTVRPCSFPARVAFPEMRCHVKFPGAQCAPLQSLRREKCFFDKLTKEWPTGFARSRQQNMRLCPFLILKKQRITVFCVSPAQDRQSRWAWTGSRSCRFSGRCGGPHQRRSPSWQEWGCPPGRGFPARGCGGWRCNRP